MVQGKFLYDTAQPHVLAAEGWEEGPGVGGSRGRGRMYTYSWLMLLYGRNLEKEVATHSSILTWKISWTEEGDGLQPMGSQRVRHDLATEQQQYGRNQHSVVKQLFSN